MSRFITQGPYNYRCSIVTSPLPYVAYRATMAVEPVGAGSSRFTWTGVFEPKGMTDAEGVAFAQGVYAMGIGLMQRTFAAQS